jgi:hypothetical protein
MKKAIAILGLFLVSPLTLLAGPVEVGQPLPALTLKDQHDQAWQIGADTKLVLFAAGRKASNLAQAVLSAQPKGFLEQRKAVYMADMSRMPGFVTRTFALPSLREQPFRVGVSLDERVLADWPAQPDAVLLIDLEQGRVSRTRAAGSETELRAALGLQP